jgi:hypothetical protein
MSHLAGVPANDRRIERAIVLQLLRDDHDESWSRAELASTLNVPAEALDAALRGLIEHGVAQAETGNDDVQASACVRRLDALAVIGV